jgi:tripartite-type tricarboxylate transporter receptor subunit TctC
LVLTAGGPITIYPHVYPNLGYDPLVDLLPITQVMKFDLALAVSGKSPVRSMPELVAWLEANPEQATFGSPGAGAAPHFLGIELGRAAKLDMRHIAYPGTPIADLMTGRLPMHITTVGELIEHHKSGSVRILATASASRSPVLPDVPTLRESGFDLVAPNWFAIYAPAGTPATVAERLRAAILDALRNAEIRARIETLAYEVTGTTGEELARIQRADYERWGPIIKASGFKAGQ